MPEAPKFVVLPEDSPLANTLVKSGLAEKIRPEDRVDLETGIIQRASIGALEDNADELREKLARAKAAQEAAKRAEKRKPGQTLADDVADPKNDCSASGKGFMRVQAMNRVRRLVARSKKIVLDDKACELAVELAAADPKVIAQMLDAAQPMADVMWVEMPSRVMINKRYEMSGQQGVILSPEEVEHAQTRDPACRVAMLVERDGDQLHVHCVEHGDNPGEVFLWPMGFCIALKGQPFLNQKEGDVKVGEAHVGIITQKGALSPEEQAKKVWGYAGDYNMKPLLGKAMAATQMEFIPVMDPDTHRMLIRELSGWTRMVIATLSMLNTVTSISTATRLEGRRIIGGNTQPYASVSHAVLCVPRRIRKIVDYARREIRHSGIRHRLHEVAPHYRHLSYKPQTEGWEECVIEGETFWRKRIDGHLRGDPALGVVEHDMTVVKG